MKKVYVYDPETKEMVEKGTTFRDFGQLVMGDLPDFVSTVDGRIIHGRSGLRQHNKELGVTHTDDYKETWANFQKKRERLFTAKDNDPKRTQAIARAFNDLQYRGR
jgi:hypothetical protein